MKQFKEKVLKTVNEGLDTIQELEDLVRYYKHKYQYLKELTEDIRTEDSKLGLMKKATTKEDLFKIVNITVGFKVNFERFSGKLHCANVLTKTVVSEEYDRIVRPKAEQKLKVGQKEIVQSKEGFTICEFEAVSLDE